ncbi:RagB/SusD family nutrient uptake outer membrane protein [Hyunsoonleella pacifica]|uniref:RagB/SusD family nutrient uptake outer membrane protein n=1 Tax=Hyunsoonleella pacifica TaxID=1080224 RepID=A0A4Q9FQP7_9FLAO|nr:RagB/SusD family nutrient uptake outer membrane protein [Hyunsoonleella pacifica]TBN17781.1 RagB/SusD family nutrient uptake outer membrane protein [Hyunsoonleella pacifica]GGD09011.1 membrane protein [Hyunsoonleella pacifica]
MKLYKILTILFISITWLSCDDYLELEPISIETSGNAYETASQIEAALVGAYESFQSSEYYVWDYLLFQDVRSDNCYAGGDNPEIFQLDFLDIAPTHSRLFKHWSNIYNAISKANLVLERVDGINDPLLTEERKNQIRGEALFLRSYHYFTLVKLWGGVPLITNTITSTEADAINIPRSTAEEVYAQITSDLVLAASLLPDVYGNDASINKGRATSGAAHALAAKAYAQQPMPDYQAVLNHIEAVETSAANYQLIDYNQLFDGNNYNNAESIIEVQYLGGNEGNFGPQLLLPPSVSGDTWRKFVTPSVDLINAFDAEGDTVRKNAAILFESVQWVDEYWGNSQGTSIPFSYKWKNASGFASADNTYLIRYGDIVLLKAEALNATNQLQAAITEINLIRSRAGLPDLTDVQSSSQQVLRETILKERRLELFQEGQRWDDLARYNVLVSTMNDVVEIDLRTGNPVNYNMTEAKKLLPIPQQELDRNPALDPNPL